MSLDDSGAYEIVDGSEEMSVEDFLDVIYNSGGILAAIEGGLKPSHVEPSAVRDAWAEIIEWYENRPRAAYNLIDFA